MKKQSWVIFLLDLLTAAVFTLMILQVLFPQMGHEVGFGWQLLLILFWCAILAAGYLKPWLPPAILLVPVALVWFFAWIGGHVEEVRATWQGFFSWAFMEMMPKGSPYDTWFTHVLVYSGIMLPILLTLTLFFHNLYSLWAATLLAVACFVVQSLLLPDQRWLLLLLIAVGMLLCLARGHKERPDIRIRSQILACGLLVPILLLATVMTPSKDGERTSRFVQRIVHDVQDLWEYYVGDLPDLPIESMRRSPWMPQGDRLGGNVELKDTLIAAVETPAGFLVRGEVMDEYTGHSWRDSNLVDNGSFRWGSPLWGGMRSEAMGTQLPKKNQTPQGLTEHLWLSLTHSRVRMSIRDLSAYLPYRTSRIEFSQETEDLYFNKQGETSFGDLPSVPVLYYMDADTWNIYDPLFDQCMLTLESMAKGTDKGYDEAAAVCLQVPEDFPEWIGYLVSDLTRGAATPFEKAVILRDYLEKPEFKYTLEPGDPDPELDFVEEFLTKKQGYCVYYATALTMMCRLAGIPARYVTGYGMIQDSTQTYFRILQCTGHAWTEIYLSRIGWVPLDALGEAVFILNQPNHEPTPVRPPSGKPAVQPDEEEEEEEPAPVIPNGGRGSKKISFGDYWWVIALVLAAAALYLWGQQALDRRYRLEKVTARHPELTDAVEYYFRDLMQQLKYFGIRPQGGDTLLTFGERAERSKPPEWEMKIYPVFETMDRLRFGDKKPSREELEEIADLHNRLEGKLHKSLGRAGYFFRRFAAGFWRGSGS